MEQPLVVPAARFCRLPVIRHLRFLYLCWRVSQWNAAWRSVGSIPTGFDARVLDQVWRGVV